MENPVKKNTWFKIISNKYILITMFFIIWMLFLDNYSYLDYRYLNNQENGLENNKTYYQQEIEKDNKNIKLLKNPDQIEKYAREKYFMKKDSEDVYIIEFEGDTIKKENQ